MIQSSRWLHHTLADIGCIAAMYGPVYHDTLSFFLIIWSRISRCLHHIDIIFGRSRKIQLCTLIFRRSRPGVFFCYTHPNILFNDETGWRGASNGLARLLHRVHCATLEPQYICTTTHNMPYLYPNHIPETQFRFRRGSQGAI